MNSDSWEKLLISLASIIVTAVVSEIIHRLRSRSAIFQAICDRYVAETRLDTIHDTPAERLGIMQRAGLSRFTEKEISKFCDEVVHRGCTHPFKDSDLSRFVHQKHLPLFLSSASAQGISLSNDLAIYGYLLEATADTDTPLTDNASEA